MVTLMFGTIEGSVTGVFVTCSLGGNLSFDWMPLLFVNCILTYESIVIIIIIVILLLELVILDI